MEVEIIDTPFTIDIYGFGGTAVNKEYAATAFKLSGRMWDAVKAKGLKNKGKNIWVYENNEKVFAGIQLNDTPAGEIELEHKAIVLEKYAYYKHIGPYSLIKQAGQKMNAELAARGYTTRLPYIEIYGHWTNDETKCETELFMSIQ